MGIREWVGKNYKEVVRWGALSDIVSTGPFALPIIVNLQIANLKLVLSFSLSLSLYLLCLFCLYLFYYLFFQHIFFVFLSLFLYIYKAI